jgi:RND family efflux transporter MFP subunit
MRSLKIVLPVALLLLGAAGAFLLIHSRSAPETRLPTVVVPLVRVLEVQPADLQLTVASQGSVQPRVESVLAAEVSGRIVEVSPAFVAGGRFDRGDLLLRLEDLDFRQAVVQAESALARSRLALERERAEAEVALREWEELGRGEASPLTRREPQLADAEAAVRAAEAALARARRDLGRATVRAPYAGRLRDKHVDLGQFVNRGTPLARIYGVDAVEIPLPVPDEELAFLELPRGGSGPAVRLSADFGGTTRHWSGRIVRTAGAIDPATRMLPLIARVDGAPELTPGLFVQAKIEGITTEGVVALPREVLRDDGRLLVVDDEDRLRFREVEILRLTDREVLVRSGLAAGERVCASPLVAVSDGMQVRSASGGSGD